MSPKRSGARRRPQLDQAEQNLRDSRLVAAKDGVVLARYVNSRVTVATRPARAALCGYEFDVR